MPTVTSDKAEIYYEVYGEGAPVVFAHGRGGNAASWWQQVPHFAKDYRVIVFDHRSFGRSVCAHEEFDRTKFDIDLLAMLDAESIERTAIVCQSMGGWTGLRTTVYHPARVSCLVLSNTPGGIDTPEVAACLENSQRIFAEKGVGRAAVAPDFPDRNPEGAYLYAQIGGLNVNLPPDLRGRSTGPEDKIEPAQLSDVDTPTLFITSENDLLFPPEMIRGLSALIPGAECIELPTAGHSPYFETPDAFNATVAAFLAKHSGQ